MNNINTEDAPTYSSANNNNDDDNHIISLAKTIIARRFKRVDVMSSSETVKNYLTLHLAEKECEIFSVIMLDNQNRVIEFKELFRGTVNSASVYPREVVKEVLSSNASSVIFTHNHPSGLPDPSESDKQITKKLIKALELIDVKVLDHIIIGGAESVSFSEAGYL